MMVTIDASLDASIDARLCGAARMARLRYEGKVHRQYHAPFLR